MADKIKVIIKRPDEPIGHVAIINNTLERFQMTVKGYIEAVPLSRNSVIICNENGKIDWLDKNFKFGIPPFNDIIYGTVIICGTEGEEFADVPFDLKLWEILLKEWGN